MLSLFYTSLIGKFANGFISFIGTFCYIRVTYTCFVQHYHINLGSSCHDQESLLNNYIIMGVFVNIKKKKNIMLNKTLVDALLSSLFSHNHIKVNVTYDTGHMTFRSILPSEAIC